MNLQTSKHLSSPFVFLKKRHITPVKQKRKNVFCSDYALNGEIMLCEFPYYKNIKELH